jgi:hypothetical protein
MRMATHLYGLGFVSEWKIKGGDWRPGDGAFERGL